MRAPIDINKKYQTRNGRKVHLYEGRNEYFYGRYCGGGLGGALDCWTPASWNSHGICNQNFGTDFDLIPVKQWRSWKEGERPKRFMVHWKNHAADTCEIVMRPMHYSDAYLFENASWLHEDGTTTPCGVEE